MADQVREIALITNPTAGKGKGGRAREAALTRLRDSGLVVRNLAGRDAAEALDLARQCVADGVEALVVCGGDGMVNLGVQAVAGTSTALGIIPAGTGNDVARYFDLPRNDPVAAAGLVVDRLADGRIRTVDLARSGGKYFVTVMAAGFDAIVNERANRMTWPKGQMRYNIATLAELRTFRPLAYTLDLDGQQRRLDAMLVADRQRAVVRRRAADHRGCPARRRPARRGHHQADEQGRPGPYLSQAVQGHPRDAPAVRAPPRPHASPSPRRASSRTPTASGSARCP